MHRLFDSLKDPSWFRRLTSGAAAIQTCFVKDETQFAVRNGK